MSLQSELVVQLDWDGRRVNDVHVRSTTLAASRLLVGRTAGEVRNIVPSLYSVCARAHAAAATAALAAAASVSSAAMDLETPSIGVVLEAVGEHVRCLLIDWPRALGREPNASPVARAQRKVEAMQCDARAGRAVPANVRALESTAADFIYGMPSAQWLQIETVEALQAWLDEASVEPALGLAVLLREHAALGASAILPMPAVGATTLHDPLAASLATAPEFERYPTWNGSPVETGVLARTQSVPLVRAVLASFGNGVVARIVARLAELAMLLQQLAETQCVHWPAVQVCTDTTGAGVAAVQTARGLLLHRARVEGDRVTGYRIVAPTQWNFHPDGPLASGLRRCTARDDDDLLRRATFAVCALDPCVATRIEVGYA
ncbi:MAG TPA: nickel-dependent hydrogenase large subunit [Casimicrobiaceae bacterium]|nr:nickel-dependent hydrogenase large subunit [Casimicrobiaceae bacterium]